MERENNKMEITGDFIAKETYKDLTRNLL